MEFIYIDCLYSTPLYGCTTSLLYISLKISVIPMARTYQNMPQIRIPGAWTKLNCFPEWSMISVTLATVYYYYYYILFSSALKIVRLPNFWWMWNAVVLWFSFSCVPLIMWSIFSYVRGNFSFLWNDNLNSLPTFNLLIFFLLIYSHSYIFSILILCQILQTFANTHLFLVFLFIFFIDYLVF